MEGKNFVEPDYSSYSDFSSEDDKNYKRREGEEESSSEDEYGERDQNAKNFLLHFPYLHKTANPESQALVEVASVPKHEREDSLTFGQYLKDVAKNPDLLPNEDDEDNYEPNPADLPPEQERILSRQQFLNAAAQIGEAGSDEDEDLFVKKSKVEGPQGPPPDETANQDNIKFFQEERQTSSQPDKIDFALNFWLERSADPNEQFVKDYIWRELYKNSNSKNFQIPQVIGDDYEDEMVEHESNFAQQIEMTKYRHQEAGGTHLEHPTHKDASVRETVSKKKQKRERKKQRQLEEQKKLSEDRDKQRNQARKDIKKILKEVNKISKEDFGIEDFINIEENEKWNNMMQSISNDPDKKKNADLLNKKKEKIEKLIEAEIQLELPEETEFKFHYTPVKAKNYGMSIEEILDMDDKDLEKKIPLKIVMRSDEYRRKSKNIERKMRRFSKRQSKRDTTQED